MEKLQQERIYKLIFEQTDQYIIVLDTDGCITSINQNAAQLFRGTQSSLINLAFDEVCKSQKITSPLSKKLQSLKNDIILLNQKIYIPTQKKIISFKISLTKESADNIHIMLIGTDVTRVEKTLQRTKQHLHDFKQHNEIFDLLSSKYQSNLIQNAKSTPSFMETLFSCYESLIDLIPNIVFWKALDGTYLGCNEELVKLRNYKSKISIIGKTDFDIFSSEEASRIAKNDQEVIKSGETLETEEYIINASGTTDTYISTKRPIRNSKNVIIGVLGISTKITERKKNETELENQTVAFKEFYDDKLKQLAQINKQVTGQEVRSSKPEEFIINIKTYLENIIAQLPGLVFWKDQNGIYLGCNDNLMHLRGCTSRSQVVGKTDYGVFSDEEAKILRENDQLVMSSKKIMSVEETVVMKNSQTITYFTNKVPLLDDSGNSIGVLGISLDITEKKQVEAALKIAKDSAESANQAKSEFLANMSHDLRAPLHGILGMTDVLNSKPHSHDQADHLKTLKNAGTSLLELIEDLLSYSEVENESEQLVMTDFDINKILQETLAIFMPQVQQKKLTLHHKTNIPDNILIQSHPKAIKRIITNLLNNALKFTDSGCITLSSKIIRDKRGADQLKLKISDTGIGIPKQNLKTIFEKFSRVTPSFEGKYKGVGLGLAIVSQFVKTLKGTIKVDSKLSVGTTFTITLPIIRSAVQVREPVENESISPTMINTVKNLNLNILVIEDDQISRQFAKIILQSLNCNVTLANDGTEAIEKIKHKYDMIFSDIGLPDISGFEVAKHIREEGSINQSTILIALTGHAADSDSEACLKVGFNEVLQKPLSMEGFQKEIIKRVAPKINPK